jgi:two-component system, NarL family, response regulator NreC
MSKTRILVVDDHSIVREGLCQLLNSQPDMEVTGEAEDGLDALQMAKSLVPDVTLIDIAMPRLNGIEAIRLIKEAVPVTQIVVLSMHKKEVFVHEVLSAGALGYVLKAAPSTEVLEAIRAARNGRYFLSSMIEAEVISAYLDARGQTQPAVKGYDLLSEREQQVFRLVVEGRSTNQIAELLCISPKTVEKHRTSMMRKLGVDDILGLVKYAVKTGLLDPELWED